MTSSQPTDGRGFNRWVSYTRRSSFVVEQLRREVDATVSRLWERHFARLPLPTFTSAVRAKRLRFADDDVETRWQNALNAAATARVKPKPIVSDIKRSDWDDPTALPWALARALVSSKTSKEQRGASDCDETFVFNFLQNAQDTELGPAATRLLQKGLSHRNKWAHSETKKLTANELDEFTETLRGILRSAIGGVPPEFDAISYTGQVPLSQEDFAAMEAEIKELKSTLKQRKSRTVTYDLPPDVAHYVPRAIETDAIVRALLHQPCASVAITGMGGAGKSVLAVAVAHDQRVAERFTRVFWVKRGVKPTLSFRDTLVDLAGALGIEPPESHIRESTTAVCQWLCGSDVDCLADTLLVIDDIWSGDTHDIATLKRFWNVASGRALLVTTRLTGHFLDHTSHFQLDVPSRQLAEEMLRLAAEIDSLPPVASKIIDAVDSLPLALGILGTYLRSKPPRKWDQYEEDLRRMNVAWGNFITSGGADNLSLYSTIQLSLEELPGLEECYLDLAVFPRGAIPRATLDTLWGTRSFTFGTRIADELVERSLARENADGSSLYLHDLQHDFAAFKCSDISHRHAKLLQAYSASTAEGKWWETDDDGYFYDHCVEHLVKAERQADATALLLEFSWLQRCLAVSFGTLDHNLAYIREHVVNLGNDPEIYIAIHCIARRARDVLLKSDTLSLEFASQLYGSLKGSRIATAPLETLLQSIRSFASSHLPLWLEPVWNVPALEPPTSPLVSRLYGHTSNVTAIAVLVHPHSPPLVVSAAFNGEVCVWDMSTYKCVRSAPHMLHTSCDNILVAPDKLTFVLCCERKLFRFVNAENLAVLSDYHVPQKEALSPGCGGHGARCTLAECDGLSVLVIIGAKALFVVSMDTHKLVKTLPLELHKRSGLGAAYCVHVARGPGLEEVTVSNSAGYLLLWDLKRDVPLFASYILGLGDFHNIRTLWSGVNRTMVTWSNKAVALWQLPEATELTPPVHSPTGCVYRTRIVHLPAKKSQVISVRGQKQWCHNPSNSGDGFSIEFISDVLSERGVHFGERRIVFGVGVELVDLMVQQETQSMYLIFRSGRISKLVAGDCVDEQLVYKRTQNAALPVFVLPPGNLLVSAEWHELIVLNPAHSPQTTHENISVSAHQGNKIAVSNDQGQLLFLDAMSMRPLETPTCAGRMVGDGILYFEEFHGGALIDIWTNQRTPVPAHVVSSYGTEAQCTFRHRNGDVYAVFEGCSWRWSRAKFKQVLQKLPHSGLVSGIVVLCEEQIAVFRDHCGIQVWLLADGRPGDHSSTEKPSSRVKTSPEDTSLPAPSVDLGTCSDRLSSMRLVTRRIASVGDDRCFVSASGDATEEIMVWRVEPEAGTAKLVRRMGDGVSRGAFGLAVSPDTHLIAVAFYEPPSLQVWDRATCQLIARCPIDLPSTTEITSAAVFLDNRHVVLACRRGVLLYRIP